MYALAVLWVLAARLARDLDLNLVQGIDSVFPVMGLGKCKCRLIPISR
jgi:hypothetical protein